MKKEIFIVVTVAIIVVLGVVAGCGPQEVKKPPDQVSVQLKWLHSVQFVGMYLAEQKGFYAGENIAVTFNTGGPDTDEIEPVASGRDDFGTVSAPQILRATSTGIEITAIAVIFRINPTVYFTMADSGIETPVDFAGKKVRSSSTDFVLPVMMSNLGIDMDQLQAAPPDIGMEAFFSGEVDVWQGYLTDQVITARSKGYKLKIFYPDDYGVHVYNDIIIATARLIDENPGLVEGFLRATLRGWRYAIENPDEAVAITLQYDDTLDKTHVELVMEAQTPLIHTGEVNIGWMEDSVWEGMHQILLDGGILTQPIKVAEAYTMQFLNKIYGEESKR